MNRTKNEYRPLAERKVPEDMTLPELVREFASLRVQAHWAPRPTGRTSC